MGSDPGREDCDALLANIADLLHGELDPERAQHLRAHMDACPPCFETADFQAQLRQLVAKRCNEEVPADFQARVVAMLRVDITVSGPDSAGPGGPS